MDYKKAQAAENKKKATSLAVASADEAAASGAAYVITKVLPLPLPGPLVCHGDLVLLCAISRRRHRSG
jgi:hypothetical protein